MGLDAGPLPVRARLRLDGHLRYERHGELPKVGWPASLEASERLAHLKRVADRPAERAVHRRQQRHGAQAADFPKKDHRAGQLERAFLREEERSLPHLHVQYQGIEPFRELLAHDARSDQRQGRHTVPVALRSS